MKLNREVEKWRGWWNENEEPEKKKNPILVYHKYNSAGTKT